MAGKFKIKCSLHQKSGLQRTTTQSRHWSEMAAAFSDVERSHFDPPTIHIVSKEESAQKKS
jgi:hypothetical protein